MKKKAALLSLVLASSSLLVACNKEAEKPKEDAKAPETTTETPKEAKPQVLNLASTEEIPSLDVSKTTDAVSFIVLNNTMEGLFRLGEGDELKDGVAEMAKTEKSADGKTFTFHLRDNAKWSNGTPVTAADFVYAWRTLLDPKTAAEYAYIMYDVKNAQAINEGKMPVDQLGVTAVDEKTLKVELATPVPYFEKLTIFGCFLPKNEKYAKEQGAKYALEANTTIYNGPFVLSDWKHADGWTYKKNPDYWDASAVKLDTINVKVVKDTSTLVNLYKTKKVDRAAISSDYVEEFRSDPTFFTEGDPTTYFLRFNTKTPVFSNKFARKAAEAAVDTQGLAEVVLNNGSTPVGGLMPKNFVKSPDGKDFREQNGDLQKFDLAKAQEWWAQAKKELKKDTVTIELLAYDGEAGKKMSEFLKSQLETNLPGLTVNIKSQPFKQKLDLEKKMQYEFAWAGWGPDYPDPMTFMDMFVTDGGHNQTGWSNPAYDKAIADSKSTLLADPQKRWDTLLEAEKLLMDEAPIGMLYQRGLSNVQREYVKGIISHQFGADYSYKWASIE